MSYGNHPMGRLQKIGASASRQDTQAERYEIVFGDIYLHQPVTSLTPAAAFNFDIGIVFKSSSS